MRRDKEECDLDIGGGGSVKVNESSGRIVVAGPIDEELASDFIPAVWSLDKLSSGKITIMLMSDGGDCDAGFAMYDAVRLAKSRVCVVGYGMVRSMASLLLQAGEERLLSPNCSFMVHDGSVGANRMPMHIFAAYAEEAARTHERYCREMSERTGMRLRSIKELCRRETYMSAEQAVKAGFADRILKKGDL